jgi:hypothetical protein
MVIKMIDYGNLMHDAMRGLIQSLLQDIASTGELPGDHHFFITFDTMHPDVEIADWLSDRYPEEMTVVMQHRFDNLEVTDEGFSVTLNFGDNPERLKSEAALAALCGVNPLPASSGKTIRHRLNRGGSRAANNALWTIAMVRMRSDPRTRVYVERRTKEGLTLKEIHRCLKRYIIRELYPLILGDLKAAAANV